MLRSTDISIRVWGDFACFSRPEFKVERVTYPVITPSAARGVLEAIFWKPEIRYEIRRIGVIERGRELTILRNELSNKQGGVPILIEGEKQRQQRSSLVLAGVDYIVEADVVLRPHASEPAAKYLDQIRRRILRGQCHHTPYLGTREFAASFAPSDGASPRAGLNYPIGRMLFEIAYIESTVRSELHFRNPATRGVVSGYFDPLFFDAELNHGWLVIDPSLYQQLYRRETRHVS